MKIEGKFIVRLGGAIYFAPSNNPLAKIKLYDAIEPETFIINVSGYIYADEINEMQPIGTYEGTFSFEPINAYYSSGKIKKKVLDFGNIINTSDAISTHIKPVDINGYVVAYGYQFVLNKVWQVDKVCVNTVFGHFNDIWGGRICSYDQSSIKRPFYPYSYKPFYNDEYSSSLKNPANIGFAIHPGAGIDEAKAILIYRNYDL